MSSGGRLAAAEGGDYGFSLENKRVGTVPIEAIIFWTRRYSANFTLPSSGFFASSSLIIRAGNANPTIHPIGSARPPSAVASPLSLSPNQVVASLLEELIKNT